MECPTVKIKAAIVDGNPHGFENINAEDFDPEIHERFEEEENVDPARLALLKEAADLKIAAPSILARWKPERLAEAVAQAKAELEADAKGEK
jgi:hypothetical protein